MKESVNLKRGQLKLPKNRKKKIEKNEQSLKDLWNAISKWTYSLWESPKDKQDRKGRKMIWRNNGQKCPKFHENHDYRHPRSSNNFKWDKFRNSHLDRM